MATMTSIFFWIFIHFFIIYVNLIITIMLFIRITDFCSRLVNITFLDLAKTLMYYCYRSGNPHSTLPFTLHPAFKGLTDKQGYCVWRHKMAAKGNVMFISKPIPSSRSSLCFLFSILSCVCFRRTLVYYKVSFAVTGISFEKNNTIL